MTLREALARAASDHHILQNTETEIWLVRLCQYAASHGATVRQIAEACGYASTSTAYAYISRLPVRRGIVLDEELPEVLL